MWWVLVAALAFWVWGFNAAARWRHRHLPGPRPHWLLGNLLEVTGGRLHERLEEWTRRYGPMYVWYLGRQPCVVVAEPDLVRQVGLKHFSAAFHNRASPMLNLGSQGDHAFISRGMLFARRKYWAGLRAACEPLFHRAALAAYAPAMNQSVGQLEERLAAVAAAGKVVEASDALAAMTMDVIGKAAFGVDFRAQECEARGSEPPELLSASKTVFAPFGSVGRLLPTLVFCVPRLSWVWARLFTIFGHAQVRAAQDARGVLWGASHRLLQNCRAADNGNTERSGAEASPPPDPLPPLPPATACGFARASRAYADVVPGSNSLVYRLRNAANLDSGLPLSDLDICAQSFTFLLAGYETTSLALSYALYELARAPDLQRRVAQEADAALASAAASASAASTDADAGHGGGREPGAQDSGSAKGAGYSYSYADLAQLPLTEAVFSEAMRLWPPVTPVLALSREAADDCPVGGRLVPRGTRVQFDVWSMHRDARHFPSPLEFRPERFLPGSPEAKSRHPYAYLPFGVGPHKCIGYRFALEEGVVCLARLARRFELTLDARHAGAPLELRASITLAPRGGIWLRVRERHGGGAEE